ncbi:MAG TPA: IS256 family transposase [Blastocatellia bacterium]|nr:IS256 family transposase [Blastocatellia bacterium]
MTKEATHINIALIDQLLKDYQSPEDVLGEDGLLKPFTGAVLERAMQAELTHHPGYEEPAPAGKNSGNSRNGKSKKTLKGEFGALPIDVPRDRRATFEPRIVPQGQTRFDGFDDLILSLYARGMTTREIQQHPEEIYQVEVSPALISSVADAVRDEVRAWQSRPLEAVSPILCLDCIMVRSRDGAHIRSRSIYLVIGVNLEGIKEVLGLWVAQSEGAQFWRGVVTQWKHRGVADIFIAGVDGLTGLPEAIAAVFPKAEVQQCIVHRVRQSLNYVSWQERKAVAADLELSYSAATREGAEMRLAECAAKWACRYPTISPIWRRNRERRVPFPAYPEAIRRVIYTTNAIESRNRGLRKIIKNRGAFPTDESALKLLYPAIEDISQKWNRPIKEWRAALNRFAIVFEGRLPIV